MTWSGFIWHKIKSSDSLMWKCYWSVRCNKNGNVVTRWATTSFSKSILHEVRNTKRGKNSLDEEGANVAFCSQFMKRKRVRPWDSFDTPECRKLCRSNCALPLASDALICWPQPNPLSEEPSWGPKQRRNIEAALELILWIVAAGVRFEGRSVHLE